MNFFKSALPVWEKNLLSEMNITLGLYAKAKKGKVCVRAATSGFYKLFVNGKFVHYGPARCAHGFFRVDELWLSLTEEQNHIAIEVENPYINAYGYIRQEGFIQAEITDGEDVIASTGDKGFAGFRLSERIRKIQRYSYQRVFAEAYKYDCGVHSWRTGIPDANAAAAEMTPTEEKTLIPRSLPIVSFPEVFPEKREFYGSFQSGVRPENYYRDRSLIQLHDPSSGMLDGYEQDELERHLSDEAQEFKILSKTDDGSRYGGKTSLAEGQYETLSLEGERTGFIGAEISCTQDSVLYMIFDEVLRNGDISPVNVCCNIIRIELAKGTYDFLSANPVGFKYIKFLCTKGNAEIRDASLTQVICPVPAPTVYTGSDKEVSKIFSAAKQSFLQNCVDIPMDCPTRERAGWLCDSLFTSRSENFFTGKNLVEHNFLENYLLPDKYPTIKDGMLPMCYPSDHYDGCFIPNWELWFVIELEDHMKRTGDREFILKFRDKVYRMLECFSEYENSDGLLEKLPGWVFVEWSKANELVQDINFPSNMLYAMALETAGRIFGDDTLSEKAEKLRKIIRKLSFAGKFFVDNYVYRDGKAVSSGERTETNQYYAFFTGTATKEMYPELWNTLITEFGPKRAKLGLYPDIYPANAFVGNYMRLMLLDENGLHGQLLDECHDYFLYMAERTGTLWEDVSDHVSCNHGFSSYAACLIVRAEKALGRA